MTSESRKPAEKILKERLEALMKKDGLSRTQTEELEKTYKSMMEISTSYNGPLPLPEMLRKYEEIYPGLTAFLLTEIQKEGNTRRRIALLEVGSRFFGQVVGVLVVYICLKFALDLAHAGVPMSSFGSVLTGLAALVISFIGGRVLFKKNDNDTPED